MGVRLRAVGRSASAYPSAVSSARLLALASAGSEAAAGVAMPRAASTVPGVARHRVQHVFWRLEKPAGGALFLLGSLHFGDDRLYPLPAVIEAAYQSCATVILETDLRLTQLPAFAVLMQRKAEWPPGQSLADALEAADLEAFRGQARRLGLEPSWLERYRAWYCANQLLSLALRQSGVDSSRGIDRVFCGRCQADGKAIEAFESPEFQIDLFAGLSDASGAALLRESLAEIAHVRGFVEAMLTAYLAGDLAALEELVTTSFDRSPELRERFLTSRNASWQAALTARAGRCPGDDLVVVGTGHLLGPHGLVASLRQAGFAVTRL